MKSGPLQGSRNSHLPGIWGNVAVSEELNRPDPHPPAEDINTTSAGLQGEIGDPRGGKGTGTL